jgi:hypothetical protein
MAEDEGHDLWGDAWSHVTRPEEDPLIPRELWSPTQRRASAWHPPDGRAHRKRAEIGGRDAHLTFDPPEEYRPRPESARPHGDRHRQSRNGAATEPHAVPTPSRAPARARAATPEETAARLAAPPGRRRTGGPSAVSARSLARGTVVGYRRDGARTRLALVIAAIVVLAAGLFAYWMLTRPAALALTPAHAVVTVQGHDAEAA